MKTKTKKVIIIITAVILILAIGFLIGYLAYYMNIGKFNAEKYKQQDSFVQDVDYAENPIDFAALTAQNPDIYAWIIVPGTRIDYPIVQAFSEDDDYYLTHDIYGKEIKSAAIFTEKLNSIYFDDRNTVIYGHNMLNGTMFRDLRKFRDKAFFNKTPYFYIYTKGHKFTYKIFSAYRYDKRHILNSFDFSDISVYKKYLEYATNPQSAVKNVRKDVSVTENDCIVTLSTCMTNGKYRYLVQGVLISDEPTK